MFSRHKQLIIAASSCTWSLKAQTASISVITSRCSVSAANMISSYPGVLNFLKGMGHCNLTGLSVQKLTSVSLSGIDHQKCGLTGKICRQEEKKPLCCTLEAASLAVGHVVLVSSQMFYHLASPIAPIVPQLCLFHTRLSFHVGVFSSVTHLEESVSFMPK